MVDAQTVVVLVTAASVAVAAIYYVMTLRVQQRNMKATLDTRQAQILMDLYQKWAEPEFQNAWMDMMEWRWGNYDEYEAKYGRLTNPEKYNQIALIGAYYEGLGVFVKRGFIDPTLVDDLMSMYIIGFWQKFEPIYHELRKRMNSPTVAEYAEYLYGAIYNIWKLQHPETPVPYRQVTDASLIDSR
jgi:hypothetical protein